MERTYISLLLLIWLAARCSHTHTVSHNHADDTERQSSEDQDEDQEHAVEKDGKRPRHRAVTSREATSKERTSEEENTPANAPLLLATSPAGLLREDAAGNIQDKLIERGYLNQEDRSGKLDGKTQKALRAFQQDNKLPGTGAPDDLTVQRLGLSIQKLLRSTSQPQP